MSDAHTRWHSERLAYRAAADDDLPLVAAMNRQLILDEGHSNPMSEPELESRMRAWLLELQGPVAAGKPGSC